VDGICDQARPAGIHDSRQIVGTRNESVAMSLLECGYALAALAVGVFKVLACGVSLSLGSLYKC
jgi:hypothetical protein